MANTVYPDAWSEKALISIKVMGGTTYHLGAITDDIDINEGDKGGGSVPNLAGGRIWLNDPQEDGTITLTAYEVGLNHSTTVPEGIGEFYTGDTVDVTDPLASSASTNRNLFVVAIVWTDGTQSDATAISTATFCAYRFAATNVRLISRAVSYADKKQKTTYTFKFPPFSKAGVANYRWDSVLGHDTNTLPVLASPFV